MMLKMALTVLTQKNGGFNGILTDDGRVVGRM
jgi:hypothetical protein